jgi:predicted nucleotidyltransferase
MASYTAMEMRIVRQLASLLVDAGVPVRSLKIFGSRARGHSSARSDLDIAVELDSAPVPR